MAEIRLAGTKTPLFTLPDLELDEFVPVVQVDPANFKSDQLVTALKGPKVELSPLIDESLRTVEMDILVAIPGKMLVTCKVAKGRKGTLDDDGIISPRIVGKVQGVTVQAMNAGRARYGEAFQFTLDIVGSAERSLQIDLIANDDAQDANSGEFKDVLCGRIEVRTWPDVFSEADANRLIEEMEYIAPFDSAGVPAEYAINYCMHAAERGISKLLENKIDFYSVDRGHKRENGISLENMRAGLRGDNFLRSGFVKTKIEADDFVVNKKILAATKNEMDYRANKYDVVKLPMASPLARELRKSFEDKPGYHVYYVSVSDDYHTLLLVVDTHNSSKRIYAFYDQGGLTSSRGPLVDIETGLERQTSWSFLHFYKKNGFNLDLRCGTMARIWKIQRKF